MTCCIESVSLRALNEVSFRVFLCTRAPQGSMSAEADGCPSQSSGEGHSPTRMHTEVQYPKEAYQQKLTGARRGSSGEGHSPTRMHTEVQFSKKQCHQKLTDVRRGSKE